MKAPVTRSDISLSWLEYILTEYESSCTRDGSAAVHIKDFKVSDGNKDGDGFVGDIVKLVVQASITRKEKEGYYKVKDQESSQEKEYNLVVKLVNQNPNQQYFFEFTGFYIREYMMYTAVIPELNRYQEEHTKDAYRIHMPKCIYSKCTDGEFVLVLENLVTGGFNMHSNDNNLGLSEVKLVIDQLVKLHAVSYAYDKSFNFLNKFPDFSNTDYHRYMSYFETSGIIDILVDISNQLEGEEIFAKKLKDIKENLIQKAKKLHNSNETHTIHCLNHGDPHANNMLFRYKTPGNSSKVIDKICVLDWQLAQWNTPIYDLQYMINTSTSPEFRKTHLSDILQYYHCKFTEITNKLNTPVTDWTLDVFKKEYSKMYLFGLIKGIYITSIQSDVVAKRTKDRERSAINSSALWKSIMYNISKIMVYFIFTPTVNSFVTNDLKWRLQPLIHDILSGQDIARSSKILGSLVEADEEGLFDEVDINKTEGNCFGLKN